MSFCRRLAATLGILVVFVLTAVGMPRASDFVPVLHADDPGKPVDPPNTTSNKKGTDPNGLR